ncbi:hypothetical protein D6779_02545, partial [Candidatus Parcubacteria bacterium]
MNRSRSSFFVFAIASLLVTTLACRFHWEERENITLISAQYYLIDPSSLLDAIAHGEAEVFVPVDTRPETVPPSQPVTWSQADYLRIAGAVFEQVFGETLDGWYLNSMDFSSNCTEIDIGL